MITNRTIRYASLVGWVVGATIVLGLTVGVRATDLASVGSIDVDAADRHLTEEQAVAKASDWARPYIRETLGQDPSLGDSLSLDDMELVNVRFIPNARNLVTSVTTATALPEPRDVWVLSWERGGVANVTTGRQDGTAHLVLVIDDGTGKVRDAVAGVRQPEDQARATGPWPSFDELLGDAFDRIEQEYAHCSLGSHSEGVTAITCK